MTELQVPQVTVEEHGVELCRAAWVQVFFHHFKMGAEDLVGVHSAAGHLGPVAGVCGGGHDLAVGGRWRHAAQHDGRETREIGESGLGIETAIGKLHQAGREVAVIKRLGQLRARCGKGVALLGRSNLYDDAAAAGDQRLTQAR